MCSAHVSDLIIVRNKFHCCRSLPFSLLNGFSIKETVKILCLNSNFLNSFQTAVSNLGSSESCKDVPGKKFLEKKPGNKNFGKKSEFS